MFSGDLVRRIETLERRLQELQSGRRLEDAAVGARGLRLIGSSLKAIDPDTTEEVLRLGILEDGNVGLVLVDPDTGREVSLSTLAFGLQADYVGSSADTSGGTWEDLDPPGPSVTVRVGNSRKMTVTVGADMDNLSTPTKVHQVMSFEISGPEDIPPAMGNGAHNETAEFGRNTSTKTRVVENLDPGIYTVTAKYIAFGGTGMFTARTMVVQPY